MLYERLLDYESKYIERILPFKATGTIENAKDDFFLRKSNNRLFMMSRDGGMLQTSEKTEMFFYPVHGKMQVASSDYHTNFRVLENKDSIEFTLAIPKYFYGHNIAQWVPNIDSRRYKNNPFVVRELFGQADMLHERIIEFIYTFFADLSELLSLPSLLNFDIRQVEIKRIDFCYNQLFQTRAMAYDFLTAQRKFYKTRVRSDSTVQQDRETSLFFRHSTDGFFYKMYLKGAEFEANDFPRLMKINESFLDDNAEGLLPEMSKIFQKHFPETFNKYNSKVSDLIFSYYKTYARTNDHDLYCQQIEAFLPFKLWFLLNEAHKILRYEMSFTSTYMSTIFKSQVYRSKDPNWQKLLSRHNLVKRYDLLLSQGNIEKAKAFKLKYILKVHSPDGSPRLNPEDRYIYEMMDRTLRKKHSFFLVGSVKMSVFASRFLDYNNITTFRKYRLEESNEQILCKDLLKIMFKKFIDEIEFFQCKDFQDTFTVLEQIDIYNAQVDAKVASYKKAFGEAAFKNMTHTKKSKGGFSKINKPRLKIILDRLEQGRSLNQIFDELGYSKSSRYSTERDLKLFDVHRQTVKRNVAKANVTTCLRRYYENFHTDKFYHRKMFTNPFLISFDTIRDQTFGEVRKKVQVF